MNIVQANDCYRVYGDSITMHQKLPIGTYKVAFNQLAGFQLFKQPDFVITEKKIYGATNEKIEKVLRGFSIATRNFGIILSGEKGARKSLFARQLSMKAAATGLPTIIVNEYTPGIADFLSSIQQEVLVIFDEFEKTFSTRDNSGEENTDLQGELLSMFDGTDGGKKLFVITCNDIDKLHNCLLGRPGRFHYHFELGFLSLDAIEDYLKDNLNESYYSEISAILAYSAQQEMTYDILRAIVFELNLGYSAQETLNDLNIKYGSNRILFDCSLILDDGTVFTDDFYMPFNENSLTRHVVTADGAMVCHITFNPADLHLVRGNNQIEFELDPSKLNKCTFSNEKSYDTDSPYYTEANIKKISIVRQNNFDYTLPFNFNSIAQYAGQLDSNTVLRPSQRVCSKMAAHNF